MEILWRGRRTSAALLHVPGASPGDQTRAGVPSRGASGVTSPSGPSSVPTPSAVSRTANG